MRVNFSFFVLSFFFAMGVVASENIQISKKCLIDSLPTELKSLSDFQCTPANKYTTIEINTLFECITDLDFKPEKDQTLYNEKVHSNNSSNNEPSRLLKTLSGTISLTKSCWKPNVFDHCSKINESNTNKKLVDALPGNIEFSPSSLDNSPLFCFNSLERQYNTYYAITIRSLIESIHNADLYESLLSD